MIWLDPRCADQEQIVANPKKKTLGSIIAAEQDKDRPAHYPVPAAAEEEASGASVAKRRTKSPSKKPPKKGSVGERRRMISADLSGDQYRSLRDMADDLGCSKVEVIRAFIELARSDADLLDRVRSQLGTEAVHRPRGFAYLAARSEGRSINT